MKGFLLLSIVSLLHDRPICGQPLPFDTIVSFGDSNTDTGNVYNLTGNRWPSVPPYYKGRFSNGPLWIEKLGVPELMNYAYGDATIVDDNLLGDFTRANRTRVPAVRQQIVKYLSENDITNANLSRTLHVIWAGNTEYLSNVNVSTELMVTNSCDAMEDLLLVGIDHLLIINLPPLNAFPRLVRDATLESRIVAHNNYLLTNISRLQASRTDVSMKLFDVYSLIKTLLSKQSTSTLNKVDPCWTINNRTVTAQCANPDDHVFIDSSHFSSVVHQLIADRIRQFLLSSPSPLPSRAMSLPRSSLVFVFIGPFLLKKVI